MSRPEPLRRPARWRQASAGFAAALDAAPDNEIVAAQALRHAVIAGDWPLAVRAARITEARNAIHARRALPAARRRGAGAGLGAGAHPARRDRARPAVRLRRAGASRLDRAGLGPGRSDRLAAGRRRRRSAHRRLCERATAVSADRRAAAGGAGGGAGDRRRRAARACGCGSRRRRRWPGAATAARRSLWCRATTRRRASPRRALEAGRPLPGAIDDARTGMAEVLQRIALDLNGQQVGAVAATFAEPRHLARAGQWRRLDGRGRAGRPAAPARLGGRDAGPRAGRRSLRRHGARPAHPAAHRRRRQ